VEKFDVVVLGTGGAGLTAALAAHEFGAYVGVFEKTDVVGGTTAYSGGMLWIPNNPHMAELDILDSREEALEYLYSLSLDVMEPELVEAFVDGGPQMISFLEERTPARFRICEGFVDYHPEKPGGKGGEGGRSLECPLFTFSELGEWADKVAVGRLLPPNLSMTETPFGRSAGVSPEELSRRTDRGERASGQALIGRLLRGCLDRGIEPRTGMRAVELVVRSGRVSGVKFEDGSEVAAARGVVLATGGFEWDEQMVRSFLRGPMTGPVSIPSNTGDGLKMAMRVGVSLGNMREAWWLPVIDALDGDGNYLRVPITGERALPHSLMVNSKGVRFVNEAATYNAFGGAFHTLDASEHRYVNMPCWYIADHQAISGYYGLVGYFGVGPVPAWLTSAASLPELAEKIGVPAESLVSTVDRFNGFVDAGNDEDFGRGNFEFDLYWGDPNVTGDISATMGRVDTGPFYAVEVYSGTLGTKGGPRTTGNAQVLDLAGDPLPGLYAVGNAMSSSMAATYGGGGGTLGPGLTFGYLAGRHAAGGSLRATPIEDAART
jgi:3-oxosteroid 1-dehydrogenase